MNYTTMITDNILINGVTLTQWINNINVLVWRYATSLFTRFKEIINVRHSIHVEAYLNCSFMDVIKWIFKLPYYIYCIVDKIIRWVVHMIAGDSLPALPMHVEQLDIIPGPKMVKAVGESEDYDGISVISLLVTILIIYGIFCYFHYTCVTGLYEYRAIRLEDGNLYSIQLPAIPNLYQLLNANHNVNISQSLESNTFRYDALVDAPLRNNNALAIRQPNNLDFMQVQIVTHYVGDPSLIHSIRNGRLYLKRFLPTKRISIPYIKFKLYDVHGSYRRLIPRIKWSRHEIVSNGNFKKFKDGMLNLLMGPMNFEYNLLTGMHMTCFINHHLNNIMAQSQKGINMTFLQYVQLAKNAMAGSSMDDRLQTSLTLSQIAIHESMDFCFGTEATSIMSIPRAFSLE